MDGFSDELTEFIFSVENSIFLCKPLGEFYKVFQWLFENVDCWETLLPDAEQLEDLWSKGLPAFINARSDEYWKNFDFENKWLNKVGVRWLNYGLFKFQNSNDAMLFKLRWA